MEKTNRQVYPSSAKEITIVYDGDCPFCSKYVRYVRLKSTIDHVAFINARGSTEEIVVNLKEDGYDLNEGMIVLYGGSVYHGSGAMHILALLTSPVGIFNRVNAAIFRRKSLSIYIYPLLVRCRKLALRILGREEIY